ncbi:MAG TPA: ASKHA domain-containing protein [Candidatus Sulfomarinibacteraceae bacterium]|nr:ASKHA domain-containing protein [Candidatus Sulfomarinibacteraceae bacterium]
MPDVIHGTDRRPLVAGRSLFEYADEVAAAVPASCRRTGRCRECVVEVRQGGDALSERTEPEAYLPGDFRLACQARVERVGSDIEFSIIRRRMRILGASGEPPTRIDPVVTADRQAVRYAGQPIDLRREHVLGLAIDIGTTTVVFQVIDLLTGAAVAGGALENPQRFGGSDVMTRISYEQDHPGTLRTALRRSLNHELRDTYRAFGIDRHEVYEAMIVANSTMRDLFFDLDVAPMGEWPYRSVTETAARSGTVESTWLQRRAHDVGLLMHPYGRVVGAPLIASHVGADTAADLSAVEFDGEAGIRMLIDIGTNTEVVVTDGVRYLAASCPAGPAFEGGLVRFGMPGADGAIEAIHLDGDRFEYTTIGEGEPAGICGSGLVDLLAELRGAGWMDAEGRFHNGLGEFMIAPERGISFSRSDASLLAQAKAANACGQRILLRRLGVMAADVDRVYLAGGFANAVHVPNAIAIGLLAPARVERVERVGNAALRGAVGLLLSASRRDALDSLIGRIEHVELETEPDFFELFVEGCRFVPLDA